MRNISLKKTNDITFCRVVHCRLYQEMVYLCFKKLLTGFMLTHFPEARDK